MNLRNQEYCIYRSLNSICTRPDIRRREYVCSVPFCEKGKVDTITQMTSKGYVKIEEYNTIRCPFCGNSDTVNKEAEALIQDGDILTCGNCGKEFVVRKIYVTNKYE